jgi:hypothetical protein
MRSAQISLSCFRGPSKGAILADDGTEPLPGTLDLLIPGTPPLDGMHDRVICQRVQQISRDVFQVDQGSLRPALQRVDP